ncbi:hypothetical protein FHS85_001756 [Rhodoligotrophos appendicifer]|uniref:head decoration protein n=1 Tax=Rhodoligotrophos appendicifer TaxID=987056 RepID=UPI00118559C6|nr:head decoration protein [Rhodoligotrophos appendicifer]
MTITHRSYKVATDVVKMEAPNSYSRDSRSVLASGVAACEVGTVLGRVTATRKYKPLDTAASDGTQTAAGILLEKTPALTADRTVVILRRHAQVVDQSLIWPAGISASNKTAALDVLDSRGITLETGV